MIEGYSPIGFTSSVLLGLLGIRVNVTVLGKIAREVLIGVGSAVSEPRVITIVVFMRAGH